MWLCCTKGCINAENAATNNDGRGACTILLWWGRRELNPHGLLHKFLRLARLPFRHVPTPAGHTDCVKDFPCEIVAYSRPIRKQSRRSVAEAARILSQLQLRKRCDSSFNGSKRYSRAAKAAPQIGRRGLRQKTHVRLGLLGHVQWHAACYYRANRRVSDLTIAPTIDSGPALSQTSIDLHNNRER